MSRFGKLIFSIAAVLVFAGASMTARADTITVVGVDSGQFSTATVVCEFDSATNTFMFHSHEYLAYYAAGIDFYDHGNRI